MSDIAKKIRGAPETDTYSLHTTVPAQVKDLVTLAFATPIPAPDMFKVTFIVGSGKKGKQYDGKLPQAMIQVLQDIKFVEDRGASASLDCQGRYKYQHDTDKDLKFIHVFPHVAIEDPNGAGPSGGGGEDEHDGVAALGPEELVVSAPLETFVEMMARKTKSLSQKKRLLRHLKESMGRVAAVEESMAALQPVDASEEGFYNLCLDLQEKANTVNKALEAHVKKGTMTEHEKKEMVEHLGESLETLKKTLAGQEAGSKKHKKVAAQVALTETRLGAIKDITPKPLKIDDERELAQLFSRMRLLDKMEAAGNLGIKEMRELQERESLQHEIDQLVLQGQGWFPGDEYAAAVATLKKAQDKAKAAKKAASSGGSSNYSSASSASQWTTTSSRKAAPKSKATASKGAKSGNRFDLLGM